jgi:hypothetical protein
MFAHGAQASARLQPPAGASGALSYARAPGRARRVPDAHAERRGAAEWLPRALGGSSAALGATLRHPGDVQGSAGRGRGRGRGRGSCEAPPAPQRAAVGAGAPGDSPRFGAAGAGAGAAPRPASVAYVGWSPARPWAHAEDAWAGAGGEMGKRAAAEPSPRGAGARSKGRRWGAASEQRRHWGEDPAGPHGGGAEDLPLNPPMAPMTHYASDFASPWGGAWSPWDAPGRGGGACPGLAEWQRDAGSPRELEFGGGLFPAFNAEVECVPLQVLVRGPPPCPLPWGEEALWGPEDAVEASRG